MEFMHNFASVILIFSFFQSFCSVGAMRSSKSLTTGLEKIQFVVYFLVLILNVMVLLLFLTFLCTYHGVRDTENERKEEN